MLLMFRSILLLLLALVAISGCNSNHLVDETESIHIVEAHYWSDGGTTTFLVTTKSGTECSIRLNQYVFNTYGHPGRLFFNKELVDVRSEHEAKIIELLSNATFGPDYPDASPQQSMEHYRDKVVEYLESDEYVEIATNGLPPEYTAQ